MIDEYYFHVSKKKDEDTDQYAIMIASVEYWDTNGCISDLHIADDLCTAYKTEAFTDEFEEVSESIFFPTVEMTRNEIISKLKKIGLKQDKEFSEYAESEEE